MHHLGKGVVLATLSAALLVAQGDPPGRVGRLNYMEGAVSFQPAGVNEWVDATINRPLIPGDNIFTGNRGRTEMHVGSTALRLGPNTAFQFLDLDDDTVQIRLSEGTLTMRVRNLTRNQIVEVDTPNVAFTPSRPGEYRIDVNPDSQTTIVTVRDGEGEVTGGGQSFLVYARQRVVVRGDDQINYSVASNPRTDDWDEWCSARDRREDQSQSARYVSREMAGYEDLDQYGRWNDQPGYGQVWMPTTVAAGWAPYHDGHWAWIPPWGWTWVDDAPWGFAPYHYGRWASFGNRWGWIPGPRGVSPVYAPALVAWVGGGRGGSGFSLSFSIGTAAAIGWFPLGPREPYFPSYQASQGYFTRVNNTNTVINNTTINNYYDYSRNSNNTAITNIQYVNRNVQNGVTAIPQDSFARGRRVTQDARAVSSAQLASVQVFGAPSISPQRESVLGARADTASRAGHPPANVLSRAVVARKAPPAAPVPFERQQAALAKNPGRPLPPTEVQAIRQNAPPPSAPVRVVDMGRVKRVQPAVVDGPQGGPQDNRKQQQQDAERQNQQKQRQQDADRQNQQKQQQQDAERQNQQKQRQQDAERQNQQKQQQQDAERQNQQKQRQQDAERQNQQKQRQQDAERQNQQKQQQQDAERQNQQKQRQQDADRQNQQKQQQDAERQNQQKQRQQDADRQNQQKQQQDVQRQNQQKQQQQEVQRQEQKKQQQQREAAKPQAASPEPPAVERPQRQDKGKQRRDDTDKKSNN